MGGVKWDIRIQVLSMYIPNLEKLQSLSDINLSYNELTRSKYLMNYVKYCN